MRKTEYIVHETARVSAAFYLTLPISHQGWKYVVFLTPMWSPSETSETYQEMQCSAVIRYLAIITRRLDTLGDDLQDAHC
jgi:hypothetical protein